MSHRKWIPLALALLVSPGCGDDEKDEDRPCAEVGCPAGQSCETLVGGEPACFGTLEVRGQVLDARSGVGVAGATIVALDANGGARSTTVRTGSDGTYALPVPAARTESGAPAPDAVTLRVAASGYQHFPAAPRVALPVELGGAIEPEDDGEDERWVVRSAATDVTLIPLPAGGARATVSGRVDHDAPGGLLVVADQGGAAVSTAVVASDGAFLLFNVPVGATRLEGYRAGLSVEPQSVSVPAGGLDDVVLRPRAASARVRGTINMADAAGTAATSVILAVESTFQEATGRGDAPAGLRAAGVRGAFEIADVPAGRYVVLAAFENDALVRDPDQGIGGTELVHVEVPADGSEVVLDNPFKVTGAITVLSPGAEQAEALPAGDPTFAWARDPSADGYEVRVYDAFGAVVHEDTAVPRVTGTERIEYRWAGAQMEPGMLYQFRAFSYRERREGRTFISMTEDLRGVFLVSPPAQAD